MKQAQAENAPDVRTDLLTLREAAIELSTSRHKILTACVLSGVRAVEVGRAYLLRREDLESLRAFLADPAGAGVPA